MRIFTTAVAVLLGVAIPATAHGQGIGSLDSSQVAAMMANAMQMNKPASFILLHRAELALSEAQVSRLEALVIAQRDSMVARQARMAERMRTNPPSAAMLAAGTWTGDVDERGVRESMCQSSVGQADMMLGIMRDRRAAAAVLTPVQAARLPQLEASDMLKALRRP
jgi:hypothetical protein